VYIEYPQLPYPSQKQPMPSSTGKMNPRPDHGENSYKGSGKLKGMKAIITGGDSGIGRAVAPRRRRTYRRSKPLPARLCSPVAGEQVEAIATRPEFEIDRRIATPKRLFLRV
jgi:hypothetical protein